MLARAALAALLLGAPSLDRAACPGRTEWPDPEWRRAPSSEALARPDRVEALERLAFPPAANAGGRAGARTDGVVVMRAGRVVYERYGNGFGPGVRHPAWSIAKSLGSALAGRAVAVGALGVDDEVAHRLEVPPRHRSVTVRHLLEASSGIDWTETYEGRPPQASSVLAMLYGNGRRDMAAFVLAHGRRAEAGRLWAYSSGDGILLAAVLRSALEPTLGRDWPHTVLLEPLGMGSAVLERDAVGTPVLSSWLHATPRDLARLATRDQCP